MRGFKTFGALVAVCALGLAGCGEKPAQEGASTDGAETAAADGAMPANWKATDACSIVDKAAVAAAMKIEITDAQLSLVHEPGTADAATSTCTYAGPDGGTVANVMTRWSPINDNTPEAMAATKKATAASMAAFTDKPLEDVPGLGISAFLVPSISQLNVFIDKARMVMVTVEKVPDGASGKDIAIELARKAGA